MLEVKALALPRFVRILAYCLAALLGIALVGWGAVTVGRPWLEERARHGTELRLESRFGGDVELDGFSLSLYPSPVIVANNLRIHRPDSAGAPPLISARRITAVFGLMGLLADPLRVREVRLEGLDIEISRREKASPASRRSTSADVEALARDYPFLLEKVDADGSVLRILPRDPSNDPLEWDLKKLSLHSVGIARPMAFDAVLTNAKPPGLIQSHGAFGPWNRDDPGSTPVSGQYDFSDADLSVFGGISGHLASSGTYRGTLAALEVDGTTDTPDFTVSVGGHPVHLTTRFHARVDGTNGDTILDPLQAHFLDADIDARGSVAKQGGEQGKTVDLDLHIEKAPVEDFLHLVLRPTPAPLTGSVTVRTKFVLHPGDADVIDRLRLDGSFSIHSAEFTSSDTQQKLSQLSWRARGRPDSEEGNPERVASDMKSNFVLDHGVASFTGLSFQVPGAQVLLDGSSDLRNETLDFRGKLRMDATLSQTMGGFKSFLLKIVDPFFKKDGAGAVIPIKIQGTLEEPSFGLAF